MRFSTVLIYLVVTLIVICVLSWASGCTDAQLDDVKHTSHTVANTKVIYSTDPAIQAAIEKTISQANRDISKADTTVDMIDAGMKAAEPWIPAPWGMVGASVTGLAAGLARAWRVKKAGKNIAISVQPAVDAFHAADGFHLKATRRAQTHGARRLIDEAQGRRFSLPF